MNLKGPIWLVLAFQSKEIFSVLTVVFFQASRDIAANFPSAKPEVPLSRSSRKIQNAVSSDNRRRGGGKMNAVVLTGV